MMLNIKDYASKSRQKMVEIYERIGDIDVILSDDPVNEDRMYVARKIQEAIQASAELSRIVSEVSRLSGDAGSLFQTKEMEYNHTIQKWVNDPNVQSFGGTLTSRKNFVEKPMEQARYQEYRSECEDRGIQPEPSILPLREEVVICRQIRDEYRALMTAVKAKIQSVSKIDSAVRLQAKLVEIHYRAVYGETRRKRKSRFLPTDEDTNGQLQEPEYAEN